MCGMMIADLVLIEFGTKTNLYLLRKKHNHDIIAMRVRR